MSEANVALVLESIRRFEPGSLEKWAELWHEDTRLSPPPEWPESGPFVGLDAVTEQFERYFAAWSALGFEDVEVVGESEDWVVMTYRVPTQGVASGLATDLRVAVAYRVEAGLLIECVIRRSVEEALAIAGLA